jgi:hypothetical protein
MREVNLDAGPPADLQRLGDPSSAERPVGVDVPQVGDVDTADLLHNLAQLDYLLGRAPRVGMV